MDIIIKQIELLERIDRLIKLKATGSPESLALRLGISKNSVYRIINTMKELNAPVIYNFSKKSYVYEQEVGFVFGFYNNDDFGSK